MNSQLRINTNIDEWGNLLPQLSPWPSPSGQEHPPVSKEEAALAFETASLRLDEIVARHQLAEKPTEDSIDLRPATWSKNAPGGEYAGKRTKKGMPDRRTKAGKEWYASVMV